MSIYSKVPIRKPGRNAFYLNHSYRGFANIGEIKVISRPIECVPGDTFITGNISKIELSPIITNFFGELYWETWQFFVSNDMLYKNTDSGKFTDILASLQNPQSLLPLPYISTSATESQDKSNLLNYVYGNLGSTGITVNKHLIAYPFRGIIKIWDDWFRDENLQAELFTNSSFPTHLYVNYKKDRYTSAFTSTQKGTAIKFNMGIQKITVRTIDSILERTNNSYPPLMGDDRGTTSPVLNPLFVSAGQMTEAQKDAFNYNFMHTIANSLQTDPTGTGITINDLRLYNKLQKWQERNQLCGTRIKEYLLSNYGVTPNDETLQRPVLIGHTQVPVVVDPIVSNIQNNNITQSTPPTTVELMQDKQGSRGGIAGASSSFKYGKWFCKEFGWLITLGALRPKASYCQGIHKSLRKDNIVDFFNPIFEHLGQQEIKMSEIYFQNSSNDDVILGYQDIYNEMRHLEDFTAPDLANNYENKTLFRKFASQPSLAGLLPVNPTEYDYLFAYPHSTAPQATFTSVNVIKGIRPISKRSTPSL